MKAIEVQQAMRLVLKQEVSIVTIQGFEILNRLDLRDLSEAQALADSLAERAQLICLLLARHSSSEQVHMIRVPNQDN